MEKGISIQTTARWLSSFEKDSGIENSLLNKFSAGVSFMYPDSKDLSSECSVYNRNVIP